MRLFQICSGSARFLECRFDRCRHSPRGIRRTRDRIDGRRLPGNNFLRDHGNGLNTQARRFFTAHHFDGFNRLPLDFNREDNGSVIAFCRYLIGPVLKRGLNRTG